MEIILLDNLDELGIVGQKVKVRRTVMLAITLLPRKLACVATDKNLNYYSTLIESKKKKLAKAKASAEDQAKLLSGLTLTFLRKSPRRRFAAVRVCYQRGRGRGPDGKRL